MPWSEISESLESIRLSTFECLCFCSAPHICKSVVTFKMLLTLEEREEIQCALCLKDGRSGCYSGYFGSTNRMMNFSFMSDLKHRNLIQWFYACKWIEITVTMFVTVFHWYKSESLHRQADLAHVIL